MVSLIDLSCDNQDNCNFTADPLHGFHLVAEVSPFMRWTPEHMYRGRLKGFGQVM